MNTQEHESRNPYIAEGVRFEIVLHLADDDYDHDFYRDTATKQEAIDKARRILSKRMDVLKIEIRDRMRPKADSLFITRETTA